MIQEPETSLSQSELEHLAELNEVFATANTAGWPRIRKLMEELVEEAHESMIGNLSSDPMTYMRLQLRWQQREAMLRGVTDYVGNCDSERQRILMEIADRENERKEYGIREESNA